jgi:hypothetical protein
MSEEGAPVKLRSLVILLAPTVVLALGGGSAAARGPANQFAAGSASSETSIFVVDQHASFSAHNTGVGCEATGQVVFDQPTLAFTAKINVLVILGQGAYFGGPVTKAVRGPVSVGESAYFDAVDSGQPGGVGDEFALELLFADPVPICFEPIQGIPITSGNVVIRASQLSL